MNSYTVEITAVHGSEWNATDAGVFRGLEAAFQGEYDDVGIYSVEADENDMADVRRRLDDDSEVLTYTID